LTSNYHDPPGCHIRPLLQYSPYLFLYLCVTMIDRFEDTKRGRLSLCYRIVYRNHAKTLTMDEVRPLHQAVGQLAQSRLGVKVR
uniref:FDX-ACB domain-containing protein n=1 Tax=Rodentolepis nana TaxID=102285 RepID=A0A0R3T1R3_RODNA